MTTIVHHSADYDGIFCREIAKRFLPGAKIIGWDFGQEKVSYPTEGEVSLLDLPPDCFDRLPDRRLIWIDHHKSAIDKWENEIPENSIPGYRIDGVAACRLAWQWFMAVRPLPEKEAFTSRSVKEPYVITLAGEYDVWQHGNSKGGDITFQFGLDTVPKLDFDVLLGGKADAAHYCSKLLENGHAAQECYRKRDADIVTQRGFNLDFDGLHFIALNTARCNSQTFEAAVKPEHDGCCAFYWNGKQWIVSLYGVPHKPEIDLSKIAVAHGGGGHKQACGFSAEYLPWLIETADYDLLEKLPDFISAEERKQIEGQ